MLVLKLEPKAFQYCQHTTVYSSWSYDELEEKLHNAKKY